MIVGIFGEGSSDDAKRILVFSPLVSPLYPWVTVLFRVLFGEAHFHLPLLIFQDVLTAWRGFSLCEYTWRLLPLSRAKFFLIGLSFFGAFALLRYVFYTFPLLYIAAEGMLATLISQRNITRRAIDSLFRARYNIHGE